MDFIIVHILFQKVCSKWKSYKDITWPLDKQQILGQGRENIDDPGESCHFRNKEVVSIYHAVYLKYIQLSSVNYTSIKLGRNKDVLKKQNKGGMSKRLRWHTLRAPNGQIWKNLRKLNNIVLDNTKINK